MRWRVPVSMRVTVPLVLLAFAATLSAVNLLYHVPQAEREAEEDGRKRLAQEMSRLQSTLEYLLLKGDAEAAQHEIEVLAHNHDVTFAALTDQTEHVITATRRAWLGRPAAEALPQFDLGAVAATARQREGMAITSDGAELLGSARIMMGRDSDELRPSRIGTVYLVYDLRHYKAEARAQVVQQSLYWAGWVAALAFAMWMAFHFLLTRRTAFLVDAAERLAAGNLAIRSNFKGTDELGRLSRAFDAMAAHIAETQTRLRRDIAERARVQRELENSEASYRAIFDAAEDAVFVHDGRTAAIVDVNAKACASFGYTREEFRAIDPGVLGTGQAPYSREDAQGLIARAFAGEEVRTEWHGKTKDGTLRWHEVFVRPVNIGGQRRVLALARDITDRKTAEAALRASEEQYRAMFDASIDGLALWNDAGDIVDANPALWRMYGYGDVAATALPPASELGPCYHLEFLRAVGAGLALHTEVTDRKRDGSMLQVEVHGIPMQHQGKPHVLTIARDVTEKKRSEEELVRQRETLHQQEKLAALGSLLAGVAHELNNPLSVVVARAVLLEERGDPSTRVAAVKIRTAAERCSRIVRTFLAMARQQKPQRGPVAINGVVADALDIAGYAIRTSSIAVELDLAPDLPLIRADADQLHQLLLNLVINAQQALQDHPGHRAIIVRTRFDAEADAVRVTVADTGPGIPAHLRARIFDPYFTTKPTGVGLGVGLAVSLGIVEAHGGTLQVECPEEGGATFVVCLPVGAPGVREGTAAGEQATDGSSRSILVVDDEADIRDTLMEILAEGRTRVVCVGSGREALEAIAIRGYDVILTDIRMANVDGRALFEEIRRRWPRQATRVVFVTGDTLASDLRDFVRATGRPVIEKPFLPDEVRRVIADTLAAAVHA